MLSVVARRAFATAPVLLGAAVFTFVLARLLPGDPVAHLASGMQASPEALAALRDKLGLNASLGVQLWRYLLALAHGDWGTSFTTGRPVIDDLRERIPATLELTLSGFLLSVLLAVPLGIAAAYRPGRIADTLCRAISSVGTSLPTFFVALLLIYIFYFRLGWAPEPTGRLDPLSMAPPENTGFMLIDTLLAHDPDAWFGALRRLVLPAVSMAIFGLPPIARITRSAMLESFASDSMRTARSLALSRSTILLHYGLAPAATAIVTTIGMIFSYMLGANVVVEKVFAWPGISAYALDALNNADYAPLQGFVLTVAIAFALLNLAVDLIIVWIDPRARSLR